MEYEKYVIVFSFQQKWKDWNYIEDAVNFLNMNKKSLRINSVSLFNSPLTNQCFLYALHKEDMDEHIGISLNFGVLKLTQDESPFSVNLMLDNALKDFTIGLDGLVFNQCYYLIEDEGRLLFHLCSRSIENGITKDDDHLNIGDLITGHPDMFYQHFYGDEDFNPQDTAFIAKLFLTVDCREGL